MELIFLHGFCESSEIWSEIVPELASGMKIHAPNLPGFGGIELNDERSLGDVAKSLLTNLNPGPDLFLVGHSLGGYLALEILRTNPDLVKGICLFHSTAKGDTIEKKSNRDKTIEHILHYGKGEFLHQFVPKLFSDEVLDTRVDLVSKMYRIVENAADTSIISYTKWMRDRPENLTTLRNSKIPVSYISGKGDKFLPIGSQIDEATSIPNGRLYVVEKAGHLAMMEAPSECIGYLKQEIGKVRKG